MENQGRYYLTKEGLERFKKEYEDLCLLRKSMTEEDVPSILHSEDINPEYLAFQENMGLLEARIAEHENVLRNYEIISLPSKHERDVVHLGATVAVEIDGQVDEYTIVGSLESNPMMGRISNESPVGKALMGKREAETVVVNSPTEVFYRIKKISYTKLV